MQEDLLSQNKTNIPEFSVSDLAQSVKKSIEDQYGRVRVRGELSRVNIAGSGHIYTSLKDDKAVIDAVCWRGKAASLNIRPEEGLEVICTGKMTTYPGSSKYQIVIDSMELAGEGALLKMLEERKKRLASEGLFAAERKRALPFIPERIGVVTSPTGAVIRDILHRLSDRFPRDVLVWPTLVQGQGAADQISKAIDGFNQLDDLIKPDLIIVARGGGSLEDLMPFNEENVVRATARSEIPIISAVGHETDTTLIDYASDLRAPTPTGAAEQAVPVRANLIAQVKDDEQRMLSSILRYLNEQRSKLDVSARGLSDPARGLDMKSQQLDRLSDQMDHVFQSSTHGRAMRLQRISSQLQTPDHLVRMASEQLSRWDEQLQTVQERLLDPAENRLKALDNMLSACSYQNALKRGFAVVRGVNGDVISDKDSALNQDAMQIEFKDDQRVDVKIFNNA